METFFDHKTGQINTNSTGYDQIVTTLTAVGKVVSKQKFYTIPFADYLPVVTGNGAFQRSILNWRSYSKGEGFEAGVINNASNKSRLDRVDAVYDSVTQTIHNWALAVDYNLFEIEEALRANTLFSLIEAREKSRRQVWDLGIQKVAFFGYESDTGLLNNSSVNTGAAIIPTRIWELTTAQFNTFVASLIEAYRSNNNRTAYPTHFIIPEPDFNSLSNFPDATYPLRSRLEIMETAFKTVTMNQGFKILPLAYADKTQNTFGYNVYTLLNYAEDSLKMDLPIDYTQLASGTQNGFNWENVAYGSFTGVVMQRPLEVLYFTNTAT